MIIHHFTCGCAMNEGDTRSAHPSDDYRAVSCTTHQRFERHVWPHHVDETTRRIPPVDELIGEALAEDITKLLKR